MEACRMNDARSRDEFDDLASPSSVAWAVFGAAVGAVIALMVLPRAVPLLVASLASPQPKVWWHLSRASGMVAYGLLATSMLLGLLLSTRFAKTWPGTARAFALHEHASILALAFALFHAIVLLGDRHTTFTLAEIVTPFGASHRPVAVGLGQLAIYGVTLLVASFYVRKRIGQRAWRWIHFASFAVFVMALVHGLVAGTDRVIMIAGVVPAALVLFFGIFRGLAAMTQERRANAR
jgi:predicted ferric reductase